MFNRVTTNADEAKRIYEKIGLDPKFISFFWRRDREASGLSCVLRYFAALPVGQFDINAAHDPDKQLSIVGIRLSGSTPTL